MDIYNTKTFFEFIEQYSDNSQIRIFRGVSNDNYKLIPSIGRLKHKSGQQLTEDDEDLIFKRFKQRSKPFLSQDYDDMNLLAIGQHHGLPTRLLDWTYNPLAAAYFAVENQITQPADPLKKINSSAIYIFNKKERTVINKSFPTIRVSQLEYFIPNYNDQRIINQNGLFTVHPYPWDELNDDEDITKVTIDLDYRRELRRVLNRLGVNQATVYPGLDGVANHIKWMDTNYY